MKILYISVHAILEYDELTLLTELGHDCFSLGAYTNPEGHYLLPRPGIKNMKHHPELEELVKDRPRTELTWQFIDNFDAIIVMDGYHSGSVIDRNWDIFKRKKVIWRTIGQSVPETESKMLKFRRQGMKIIRYSPMEKDLHEYCGHDEIIRFYKDPNEFCNWTGHVNQVMNLSQSLKARRNFCGYDALMKVLPGFPFKVYGSGNEDLGEFNGGELSYESMKGALRDCRVYFYNGTWPASYTLSFMEAMMTGIPIVSVGKETWKHKDHPGIKLFEIPHIISSGDNGYYSDDPEELKRFIQTLLDNESIAKRVSEKAREKAIQLFSKEKIIEQWRIFLETI